MNLLKVEISTNRLLLKPISLEYKEEIFSEFTEEITVYMYPRPPQDISETELFINQSIIEVGNGGALIFIIL
ncbi:MAG TPA: N-acetyltransferase, partial [Cyanobacteria bacterium UBA11049]|nr:N-acetyltransferase [Cyanobacteria bacterium UBA11049]